MVGLLRGGGGGGGGGGGRGRGTKDMLASPAKIIGGGGGSPSCSYAYVLLNTYRYMRKGFPSKTVSKWMDVWDYFRPKNPVSQLNVMRLI